MTSDLILHNVPRDWQLAEYRLEFDRDTTATQLVVTFLAEAGGIRLSFQDPYPLADTFALTDDATDVRVYDAASAQREDHCVRVEFLTGEGEQREFWAASVEAGEEN